MTSDNTMPRNKTFTTRKMVTVAMLSAIATVIYYLDFPVPLMPGFIKLDLSNVISLLAGFSMGPIAGVIVCLIKNVIQLTRHNNGYRQYLRLCNKRSFCADGFCYIPQEKNQKECYHKLYHWHFGFHSNKLAVELFYRLSYIL